jgi:hypothetical protein
VDTLGYFGIKAKTYMFLPSSSYVVDYGCFLKINAQGDNKEMDTYPFLLIYLLIAKHKTDKNFNP